ncbi:MAG: RagB/SusD family nutrient uptake outer membrane protein [Proteiniphilum sp.]
MKKILFLSIALIFVACDNLLDVNPTDQYSVETFWLDKGEYDAALTGCYRSFQNANIMFNGETDMVTPNAVAYNEASDTKNIGRGAGTTTSALFGAFWRNAYRGIGRTNTLLDKIDLATFDEASKNKIKGEALFIRALYYSILVDNFGDCPLITETPDANKHGQLPRTPKSDVVNQIIADLNTAASLLPTTNSSANIGRATKGAALALKSRVLLYEGKWDEAAKAAKEVIDLNVYDLFPNYRGMYLLENENNKEVIFDIQYKVPYFTHGLDNAIQKLNRPAPTKDLVDSYLMTDGKSISESPLYNPAKPYENRDPRLLQTIVCVGYKYNGKITKTQDVMTTGYGSKKLTSYPDEQTIVINAGNSEINPIVIRYGEVLLTYAEALNELGSTPNAEVYWALNKIRTRPTVNMPEIQPGLNKEQMREVIRHERRIELAMEGLYLSDIKRWRIAEIVMNNPVMNYENKLYENRSFNKNRDYLWPIPADEIVLNRNLTQNPGW